MIKLFPVLLILLFFIIYQCTNKFENKSNGKISNIEISDLIKKGEKVFQNIHAIEDIGCQINQLLLSQNNELLIYITDSIINENNKGPVLKYETIDFSKVGVYRDLYMFEICIINKDSLLVDKELVNNIVNLKKSIEKFYDLVIKKLYPYPFPIEKDSIKYFGEVEIPEIIFQLSTDIKSKRGLSKEEWKLFFTCLNEINNVIDNARNKLAIRQFGKSFDYLEVDKINAIVRVYSKKIILGFNFTCPYVQLPDSSNIELNLIID